MPSGDTATANGKLPGETWPITVSVALSITAIWFVNGFDTYTREPSGNAAMWLV